MGKGFAIIAHRGNQSLAPENTVEAFEASLTAGFPHFETDVQLTSDGVAVILHDEQLGRTIPGSGRVEELTWAQLKDLDAGSWFSSEGSVVAGSAISGAEPYVAVRRSPDFAQCRVPTLEAVLTAFLGRAHIHLELKSKQPGLATAVAAALDASGWLSPPPSPQPQSQASIAAATAGAAETPAEAFAAPGLTITSFHLEQLKASIAALQGRTLSSAATAGRVDAHGRGVRHAWLVHELDASALQEAAGAGIKQLCPRADLLVPEAVAPALAAGFTLRAWALSSEERLISAVRYGVHGGTLDSPSKARALLQQEGVDC